MNPKSIALVGTLVFVAGITVLHYSFNLSDGPRGNQLSTNFRVGFLPVT